MKATCPKCSHEFDGALVAFVPEEQRIVMEITKDDGAPLSARTLGEVIVAQEKLLKACAKDLGKAVSVFVSEVTMKQRTVRIEFFIAANKVQARKEKA